MAHRAAGKHEGHRHDAVQSEAALVGDGKVETANDGIKTTRLKKRRRLPWAFACIALLCVCQGWKYPNPSMVQQSESAKTTEKVRQQIHDGNRSSTVAATATPLKASIVVQQSGEMGNHLNGLAHAFALQALAKHQHALSMNILLVSHDGAGPGSGRNRRKDQLAKQQLAVGTRQIMRRCFPNLRSWDWRTISSDEYKRRSQEQRRSSLDDPTMRAMVNSDDEGKVHLALEHVRRMAEALQNPATTSPTVANRRNETTDDAELRIPFVTLTSMNVELFVDLHFDAIRQQFRIDEAGCCKEIPDDDEHVFHFRNFETELSESGTKGTQYEELDASAIAAKVFGSLPPGSKIAIASRYNNHIVQDIQTSLEQRGFVTRVISNPTAIQDFCFLAKARKELIGTASSSFFRWSAYLGDADIVRMLVVGTPESSKSSVSTHQWSNEKQAARLRYEFHSTS